MLTLNILDLNKFFAKEHFTGKKIIDPDADELIFEEAEKYKNDKDIKIVVVVKQKFDEVGEEHFKNKFKENYIYKVEELTKDYKRHGKRFRVAFRNGSILLVICLGIGYIAIGINNVFGTIVNEIAIIAGWVAIWHPVEYYLFDRPIEKKRIKIYENLTRVEVELLHEEYNNETISHSNN